MNRIAFEIRESGIEDDEPQWQEILDPSGTLSIGDDDVLRPSLMGQNARAYVNGIEVRGDIQTLQPGDFVRIFSKGAGQQAAYAYQYAGRIGVETENGDGRLCAYTAMPIDGPAICCPSAGCTKVYRPEVLDERKTCFCGASLESEWKPEPPVEALL